MGSCPGIVGFFTLFPFSHNTSDKQNSMIFVVFFKEEKKSLSRSSLPSSLLYFFKVVMLKKKIINFIMFLQNFQRRSERSSMS